MIIQRFDTSIAKRPIICKVPVFEITDKTARLINNYSQPEFEYGKEIQAIYWKDKNTQVELKHLKEDEFGSIFHGIQGSTLDIKTSGIVKSKFAIIPPGAEYCYGTMGEIITNKIIIYKHQWELKSYFESIEQKPKIADKDIVCKKSVSEITDKDWIPEIIQDSKFLCNIEVKALDGTKKPIEHLKYFPMFGFYSYIDVKKAKGSILVDAIVPKGSEYFEKDGIIVSNQIIVFNDKKTK